MSTLKVSSINNASASSGGLSIDSSGVVSGALPSPNRNLLYNGAMQVAQRGTSTASITTSGYYTADRWYTSLGGAGTWTQSIESDGPTGSGLTKSLKMLCTTANTSLSAANALHLRQLLEGFDVQRVAKGTASAKQLTLSFWVKSNVTGTFIVELFDTDNSRQVSASYSVATSGTWEKQTVTFPADATGVFTNDNNSSLFVGFTLAAGSDYTSGTLNTTWAANNNANRAVGQTNLASATNNYWQITGVQLEVGDAATDFEFKSYGQELAECQRYYYVIADRRVTLSQIIAANLSGYPSGYCYGAFRYPTMRSTPSLKQQTGTNYYFATTGVSTLQANLMYFDRASQESGRLIMSVGGAVEGRMYWLGLDNDAAWLALEAEL